MIKAPIFAFVLFLSIISTTVEAYTILVWGDSLSAAYGIPVEQGWVGLLRKRLGPRNIKVVNQSIVGETTFNGVDRISRGLSDIKPDLLILELGGNDGLRGLDLAAVRQNLAAMIELAQEKDIEVLLLGIKIPPNYGRTYADSFHEIFQDLASAYETAIVPFLLEPVIQNYDMMQDDGVHPSAAAQPLILNHVWPVLSLLLPE